jgi:hypothetical protein
MNPWFFVSYFVDSWVPSAKQPEKAIYSIETMISTSMESNGLKQIKLKTKTEGQNNLAYDSLKRDVSKIFQIFL